MPSRRSAKRSRRTRQKKRSSKKDGAKNPVSIGGAAAIALASAALGAGATAAYNKFDSNQVRGSNQQVSDFFNVDCVIADFNNDEELEYTFQTVKKVYGNGVRFFVYDKGPKKREMTPWGTPYTFEQRVYLNEQLPNSGTPYIYEQLQNFGRDQHTWAYHCAKYYDRLGDIVIFTPSDIRKKRPKRQSVILQGYSGVVGDGWSCFSHGDTYGPMKNFSIPEYEGRKLDRAVPGTLDAWVKTHIPRDIDDQHQTCNYATFISTRKNIRKTPRTVFENLRDMMKDQNEPEAGHFLERIQSVVYGGKGVKR